MQEKEEKTEDEKRREKWFWLCSILSFGRKEKQMLLDFFGTPEEIWQADEREIGEVFWENEEHKKAFFREKAAWDAKKAWNEMQKKGIRFISCEDTSYPQKLKEIYDYPFGLFIRGELPKENEKTVAIVGARLCSAYGRHFAVKIAEELAGYDISLVSGMARGIRWHCPESCHKRRRKELCGTWMRTGYLLPDAKPGSVSEFTEKWRSLIGISAGKQSASFSFPNAKSHYQWSFGFGDRDRGKRKKRITHHSRSGTGTGQRCYSVAGQSRRCTQCRMQPPDRPGSRHFSLHRSDPGTS